MKELRLNVDTYANTKISVEGLITVYDKDSKMAYAEALTVKMIDGMV